MINGNGTSWTICKNHLQFAADSSPCITVSFLQVDFHICQNSASHVQLLQSLIAIAHETVLLLSQIHLAICSKHMFQC